MVSTVVFALLGGVGEHLYFLISMDVVFNSFCLICSMKFGDHLYNRFFVGCNHCLNYFSEKRKEEKEMGEVQLDLGERVQTSRKKEGGGKKKDEGRGNL